MWLSHPASEGVAAYRVFDYGLDMFACYWVAIDFDGRLWFYGSSASPV
jgi:hypothetical protein